MERFTANNNIFEMFFKLRYSCFIEFQKMLAESTVKVVYKSL